MSVAIKEKEKQISPEEYLKLEREAEEKSEYWNGQIYAMAGASLNHNLIVSNLIFTLRSQLKGKPCRVYPSDLKIKIEQSKLFTYPDITVVCGEHQFDDEKKDVLLNPTVVIEVLSPSTEAYDRGKKFGYYRKLESLQEYILISQDRLSIEKYTRDGHFWVLSDESQWEKTLPLHSIPCQLSLAEVYENIDPFSLLREASVLVA